MSSLLALGFLVATRLAPRASESVTNPGKLEHAPFQALILVLFGTPTIAEAHVPAVPKAVLELRDHFKARHNRSMWW